MAPWGRGDAPGPVLEQARAFRGDRHVGPLRWSSAHRTVVDAPTFGETSARARLGPATGRPLWCLFKSPPSPPGRRYPQLLEADADGALVLSDPAVLSLVPPGSSAPRWRTPTLPFRSAIVLGEYVLAGTQVGALPGVRGRPRRMGEFAVFRRSDGRLLWGSGDLGRQGLLGDTLVDLAGDTLLIASGAELAACEIATGRIRWRAPYQVRIREAVTETYVPRATANVALAGSRVLVGEQGTIRALELADGSVAWSARTPLDPLLDRGREHGGRFYAADAKGALVVIDVATGTVEQALKEVPLLFPGPDIPFNRDRDLTVADDLLLVQHRTLTLAFPLSRRSR